MSPVELGRLKKVELRNAWQNEAADFTPWLADEKNISLLGEAINLDLEVEEQEKNVGPFRADIFCKDKTNDSCVLIENQLEKTDHTHLGQLLTYTAGLDAVTIIWIAERFTDEHRAALDWLNEKTPDGIAFFGLEVELWSIGDSPVAPKFNVVCRPNEWTRSAVRSRGNSELAELCWEYWSGVVEAIGPSGIVAATVKPFRKKDMVFPVQWRNFWLKAYISTAEKQLGVWVACRGPNWRENYTRLREAKEHIESQFGGELDWNEYDDRASCTYLVPGYDPADRTDWPRQHDLLADKLISLHQAVNPIVEELERRDGTEGVD